LDQKSLASLSRRGRKTRGRAKEMRDAKGTKKVAYFGKNEIPISKWTRERRKRNNITIISHNGICRG